MSAYRNTRSFKEQVPPSLFKAQMQKKREISIARREHSATLWRRWGSVEILKRGHVTNGKNYVKCSTRGGSKIDKIWST